MTNAASQNQRPGDDSRLDTSPWENRCSSRQKTDECVLTNGDDSDPLIWLDRAPRPLREEAIRRRIVENPTSLPCVGPGPVAIARELSIPEGGRADLVLVEGSGQITLVECKLAKNASSR